MLFVTLELQYSYPQYVTFYHSDDSDIMIIQYVSTITTSAVVKQLDKYSNITVSWYGDNVVTNTSTILYRCSIPIVLLEYII